MADIAAWRATNPGSITDFPKRFLLMAATRGFVAELNKKLREILNPVAREHVQWVTSTGKLLDEDIHVNDLVMLTSNNRIQKQFVYRVAKGGRQDIVLNGTGYARHLVLNVNSNVNRPQWNASQKFYNGTIGTIERANDNQLYFVIPSGHAVRVMVSGDVYINSDGTDMPLASEEFGGSTTRQNLRVMHSLPIYKFLPAMARTIQRSQGMEAHTAVVYGTRFGRSRAHLYTAVSRGRHEVVIVNTPNYYYGDCLKTKLTVSTPYYAACVLEAERSHTQLFLGDTSV